MEVIQEITVIDKTEWGAGPWVTEPDHVVWRDKDTGYLCLANRHTYFTGSWCGYVAIPESHPLFGKTDHKHTEISSRKFMRESARKMRAANYDFTAVFEDSDNPSDILEQHPDYCEQIERLECHGGVTYTGQNEPPTREDFEKWRIHMLQIKPTIEQYPRGDAARDWQRLGHLMNDYEAWHQHQLQTSVYIPSTEPLTLLGFDCSHAWDISPMMHHEMNKILGERDCDFPGSHYRTLAYVQAECRSLAAQLKEIEHGTGLR